MAHNAGPHLPRHETDHDIDVAWVLGSPEDEGRGAVFELPVLVLDDTVAGVLSAVCVHRNCAGDVGGCSWLHISGYGCIFWSRASVLLFEGFEDLNRVTVGTKAERQVGFVRFWDP